MAPSFNLIDEPWIPCLFAGEDQPRDASLRETLARAPAICSIACASPLETIAIHRVLLAVLHRSYNGPRDDNEWTATWEAGAFDIGRIDAYLEQWRPRFDLFDADRPFYQAATLPESVATSIAKLGHEFSSGNNPLLFDHSVDDAPAGVSPPAAARLLVAQQSFAVGGLITRLPGDPPSAESVHLLKAAVLLLTGTNLFETLVLNMVVVDGRNDLPFAFEPRADAPAWEQDPPVAAERWLRGYLDLLTWQSRRVRLFPDEDGLVRRAAILDGYRLPKSRHAKDFETMTAHWQRPKPAVGQDPSPAYGFRRERALWRDSLGLLQKTTEVHYRAKTLDHLLDVAHAVNGRVPVNVAAFGLSTDRAKIFLWRQEELPLPLEYLAEGALVSFLGEGVDAAEAVGKALRGQVWSLAATVLGTTERERISQLTDALAPERTYWPALDVHFRRFMCDLPPARAGGDEECLGPKEAWGKAVQAAAREAFEQAARAVETSGRGFRAATEARGRFAGDLARALAGLLPAATETPEEVPV